MIESLNEYQLEAVISTEKPTLILASAGTGKTHVLTAKFLYAVQFLGMNPRRIMAVTFTRKAAGEFFDEILQAVFRADQFFFADIAVFSALFLDSLLLRGDRSIDINQILDDAAHVRKRLVRFRKSEPFLRPRRGDARRCKGLRTDHSDSAFLGRSHACLGVALTRAGLRLAGVMRSI